MHMWWCENDFVLLLLVVTPILNLKVNHNKSPTNNIITSQVGLKKLSCSNS